MAPWYPVMLNVVGKLCVVIGGGVVAERKIGGLREAGAFVRIVSPKLTPGLSDLVKAGSAEWRNKEADPADLAGAALVFAAADDPAVNRMAADAARAAGVSVNIADEGEAGDFLVPAVLRRGDLVLAASASGAGPGLASKVVREFAERYGPEFEGYAAAMREIRKAAKEAVADPAERRRLLTAAADWDVLRDWMASGQPDEDSNQLLSRLRDVIEKKRGANHA